MKRKNSVGHYTAGKPVGDRNHGESLEMTVDRVMRRWLKRQGLPIVNESQSGSNKREPSRFRVETNTGVKEIEFHLISTDRDVIPLAMKSLSVECAKEMVKGRPRYTDERKDGYLVVYGELEHMESLAEGKVYVTNVGDYTDKGKIHHPTAPHHEEGVIAVENGGYIYSYVNTTNCLRPFMDNDGDVNWIGYAAQSKKYGLVCASNRLSTHLCAWFGHESIAVIENVWEFSKRLKRGVEAKGYRLGIVHGRQRTPEGKMMASGRPVEVQYRDRQGGFHNKFRVASGAFFSRYTKPDFYMHEHEWRWVVEPGPSGEKVPTGCVDVGYLGDVVSVAHARHDSA